MGGGVKSSPPASLFSDYVDLADSNPQSTLRSRNIRKENEEQMIVYDYGVFRKENEEQKIEYYYGSGSEVASATLDDIEQTRKANTYKQVLSTYNKLQRRSMSYLHLEDDKSKILRHIPGAWAENKIGYGVPKTTTLLLVGPKGSGKSSLVNRISKVFEHDEFRVDRAKVSYNSSGDGTCFLQEYRIPRHSKSFSLFDTRSLSDDSSENMKNLGKWMTEGVRHGDPIIRDSDSASFKNMLEARGLSQGDNVSKKMVSFVIFVVNGVSVLKSMAGDEEATRQCSEMISTTFNCPFLSFGDDKPVVVVTHGDLLSFSDRARIRIHLGELLGMHPTKQIFDIPENCDPATGLAIVEMLCCALELADRNLSRKQKLMGEKTLMDKVLNVLLVRVCMFLVIAMGIFVIAAACVYGTRSCSCTHVYDTRFCSAQNHQPPPPHTKVDDHRPPPPGIKMNHQPPPPDTQFDHQPAPPVQSKDRSSVQPKKQTSPPVQPKKPPPPPPVQPKKPPPPPPVQPQKHTPTPVQPKKRSSVQPKKYTPPDPKENWYTVRYRTRASVRNGLYVYD